MKFDNIEIISWDIYEENPCSDKNLGHTIKLPYNIISSILSNIDCNTNPIYIEIKNMNEDELLKINNRIIFSNFEVHDINICVAPYWAMSKLNFSQFDKISIENVNNIEKIGFIKLKANFSHYVLWDDIKNILEIELEKYHCLNLGDLISINGIEFYVIELKDTFSKLIIYGSLFNTDPSIEFDIPIDIDYKEIHKNNTLNDNQIYKTRTIEELEKDDNTNSPALSFTMTFHTGDEIKILEKHWSNNKIHHNKKCK